MHWSFIKSQSSTVFLMAFISAFLAIGDAGFSAERATDESLAPAPSTDEKQPLFNATEQKAIVEFLLQYDGGRAVHAGVTALLRGNHRSCAVMLVADTYAVPPETAALFVRLVGRNDGSEEAPGK